MSLKGLIIRQPWIELILSGKKIWEMRSKPTSVRGPIALIEKGTGTVVGIANLVDSLMSLSASEMPINFDKHRVPQEVVEERGFNWLTPWVLADARRLDQPVNYHHKSGAVIWVDLEPEVAALVYNGRETKLAALVSPVVREPVEPVAQNSHRDSGTGIRIPLTGGNIRNSHFYLRAVRHLLPLDSIGGSNKGSAGRTISVSFVPGQTIETDVDGTKMILRDRASVRAFFETANPDVGDHMVFRSVGDRSFTASLERA